MIHYHYTNFCIDHIHIIWYKNCLIKKYWALWYKIVQKGQIVTILEKKLQFCVDPCQLNNYPSQNISVSWSLIGQYRFCQHTYTNTGKPSGWVQGNDAQGGAQNYTGWVNAEDYIYISDIEKISMTNYWFCWAMLCDMRFDSTVYH